jgi:hypothetical protein
VKGQSPGAAEIFASMTMDRIGEAARNDEVTSILTLLEGFIKIVCRING